jgi:hypothetical protein
MKHNFEDHVLYGVPLEIEFSEEEKEQIVKEVELQYQRAKEIKSGEFDKKLKKFLKENDVGSTVNYTLPQK